MHTSEMSQKREFARDAFLRDITRTLYRLNVQLNGTPTDTMWIPLRQLTLELQEQSLEQLEKWRGGLREVLEKCIPVQVEMRYVRQDKVVSGGSPTTVLWFARIRPYDKRILRLSNHLDAAVQLDADYDSGKKVFTVLEAFLHVPEGVRAFAEDTFMSPLEAVQVAATGDRAAKWKLVPPGTGEDGRNEWTIARNRAVPGSACGSSPHENFHHAVHLDRIPPAPLNPAHSTVHTLPANSPAPDGGISAPPALSLSSFSENTVNKRLEENEMFDRAPDDFDEMDSDSDGNRNGCAENGCVGGGDGELEALDPRLLRQLTKNSIASAYDQYEEQRSKREEMENYREQKEQQQPASPSSASSPVGFHPFKLPPPPPPPAFFSPPGAQPDGVGLAPNDWRSKLEPIDPQLTEALRRKLHRPTAPDFELPDGLPPPVSVSSVAHNLGHHLNSKSKFSKDQVTLSDLMQFLPSFFIPVSVALEGGLAEFGYTHQHIQQYLGHIAGVQLIERDPSNPSACFIRLVGLVSGQLSLKNIAATNERFKKYMPLPAAARPFIKLMPRPSTWVSVTELLELAGKEAADALPFQGPDALMYFAQMQHIFAFSPERGGIVSRRAKPASLYTQTTPCPFFYNELLCMILKNQRVPTSIIEASVPPAALEEMQRCFPSWEAFCASHAEKVSYHNNDLVLTSLLQRDQQRFMSLEEQLEAAVREEARMPGRGSPQQTVLRRRIMQLRKRIATQSNPDNPLLDPERMAVALLEFIPATEGAHISVRELNASIPFEMKELMPRKGIVALLKRYKHLFTMFDFQVPGRPHVMRNTGAPLPPGALRSDFSPEEIVAMCVQMLASKGNIISGGESVNKLRLLVMYERLPMTMRDNLVNYENLGTLLKEVAPDSFAFVSSEQWTEVILLQAPKGMSVDGYPVHENNDHLLGKDVGGF